MDFVIVTNTFLNFIRESCNYSITGYNIFVLKVVKLTPMLRRRHFLGRIWSWNSYVPEPIPALARMGRLRNQAKHGGSMRLRLQTQKNCNFNLWNFNIIKNILGSNLSLLYTVKLKRIHEYSKNKAFLVCFPKRSSRIEKSVSGSEAAFFLSKESLRHVW